MIREAARSLRQTRQPSQIRDPPGGFMAWKVVKGAGAGGSSLGIALVILRVSLGVFLIAKGLDKLAWFTHPAILGVKLDAFMAKATPLNRWWVALLLPGVALFARLVPFGELAGGLALIAGRYSRLAATLAFLMVLNFHLATGALFHRDFLTDAQGFPVLGGLLAVALAGRK
jgi:uncharacterized membrane protein YphA (DoxX/SURF4 family)